MAKSKKARKAQKAQQRNAKQRQVQQFQQVQQSNKSRQVQELRAKYQQVIDQNKTPKANVKKSSVSQNVNKKSSAGISKAQKSDEQKINKLDNFRVVEKFEDIKNEKTAQTSGIATFERDKNNTKAADKKIHEKLGEKPGAAAQTPRAKSLTRTRVLEKTELAQAQKTLTLEDWQAKQRKRVEEAYEKKQEELKLKEVEFELQHTKPEKHFLRRVLVGIMAMLLLINAGIGGWIVAQKLIPHETIDVPHVGTEVATSETDFNQRIVNENDEEFTPVYRLGEARDLVMKFPDLKCTEGCENVQNVMLDEYFLSKEEHAIADDNEAATVILYGDFLETLAPNDYTLTFEIESSSEVKVVGVVLTVEKVELVCEEGQVLQGESCVDEAGNEVAKPTERIINYTEGATVTNPSGNQGGEQSAGGSNEQPDKPEEKPATPETPSEPEKSDEQIACERQIGPTGLTVVHWLTDEEKAEHPNAEVYVVRGGFAGATGAATMAWVNGACRPAVTQSGYNGVGNYMSAYRAQVVYGGAVSTTIASNPGQDAAVWTWKYGATTTDLMADARIVLGY